MYINIAQLLKEAVGSTRCYQIDEYVGEKCETHIQGSLILTRINRGILVKGMMASDMKGVCNRCLGSADYSINFNLEEEFIPSTDISGDSPLHSKSDIFLIEKNHILNLEEILNQYILTAKPMKLICRPDCAGVCPSCGHNLNHGHCLCPSDISDWHWSRLVSLGKESGI